MRLDSIRLGVGLGLLSLNSPTITQALPLKPQTQPQRELEPSKIDSRQLGIYDAFYDSEPDGIESGISRSETLKAASETAEPPQKAKIEKELKQIDQKVEQKVRSHPNSIPIQNSGARQALQTGDFAKALERSEKAVALAEASGEPKALVPSVITRSMARYKNKDFVGACADAERALAQDPQNVTAFEMKRFSCGRESGSIVGNAGDKIKQFMAQQSPTTPHTPDEWAARQRQKPTASFQSVAASMRARRSGDLTGALQHANAAVGAEPGDPMAWAQRGLIKADLKDIDGAVLDLSNAIAKGMVWKMLYQVRAKALLDGKKFKAAAEDATIAIHMDPRDASSYETRGFARMGDGAPVDEVLADFEMAAQLDPASYAANLEKAKAQFGAPQRASGAQAAGVANRSAGSGGLAEAADIDMRIRIAKTIYGLAGLSVLGVAILIWRKRSQTA